MLRRSRIGVGWYLLACTLANSAGAQTLPIVFVSLARSHHAPSTALDRPVLDAPRRGAELGVADNLTTGRFTGQTTTLDRIVLPDPDAIATAFAKSLADGRRLFCGGPAGGAVAAAG